MIDAGYVRVMARYSVWQNESLIAAAGRLDDEARLQDRGAFFGSIQATLNHLLWGDRTWLSRFTDLPAPESGIQGSVHLAPDWPTYKLERRVTDADITSWASSVGDNDLVGELTWFSGALGREVSRPVSLLVVHFFNHQTHHRGQAHAMLTAAGTRPEPTDLPFMPGMG
ncbi:MAG: damage-inducible protein DinB [Geminicoccaceae bacterium]|nr:damage-inducible protein DinB [Geminicoccaceae bacterium]